HPRRRGRRAERVRADQRVRAPRRAGADRPQRRRGAARARRDAAGSRADGHHDARDGRPDRHARDPPASRARRAADHRADRQGHARRLRAVPGGRRQRLPGQAARRRQARLALPCLALTWMTTPIDDPPGPTEAGEAADDLDLEIDLLLEAIVRKYSYEFRDYARASLRRRIRGALDAFGFASVSELQHHVLRDRQVFTTLLSRLTVTVSAMFRDPGYYLALRREVLPMLATWP